MKKLICNIGAIALGVLASIMAFIPMFDVKAVSDSSSSFAEVPFSFFSEVSEVITSTFDAFNDGWKGTFKTVAMILVIVAMVALALYIIAIIMEVVNKKAKTEGIKKLASLVLIAAAVLILISSLILMLSNKATIAGVTGKLTVCNWFAYLSVIIGFAGAGALAMLADKK